VRNRDWFNRLRAGVFFLFVLAGISAFGQVTVTNYLQYVKHEFTVAGKDAYIIFPETPQLHKPWLWRARFPGNCNYVNLGLLEQGHAVAYIDVAALYGSPQAVAIWDSFYSHVTTEYGFSDTPALMGVSRGGLPVYNWGKQNPEKVACIVGVVPVLDFKSWPGGFETGDGSELGWGQVLDVYGFTEEEALAYQGNPIDSFHPLASNDVPVLHYYGDLDTVVPPTENTLRLQPLYVAAGGQMDVLLVSGGGHDLQPAAGSDDLAAILAFVAENTQGENYLPVFDSDPLFVTDALVGGSYYGVLSDKVSDLNLDPLTYALVSGGPSWLSVSSEGELSGTPGAGDAGLNTWAI
jgi:pimeloyl-ACP methyl ester carboxylesterase